MSTTLEPALESHTEDTTTPEIWNPTAAILWGIWAFTPIFGTFVVMKNWEALGCQRKAQQTLYWLVGFVAFYFVDIFVYPSASYEIITTMALWSACATWVLFDSAQQVYYVKTHYGSTYRRKSWWPILALGLLMPFVYGAAIAAIGAGS